tara:strand:+ start:3231 stop:3893 length:663 start_codon:yes stop_codon:yes gene_type:complete
MKDIFLLDIEGTNSANIIYSLQDDFKIFLIKRPDELHGLKPNIILPGNSSFGYYVEFLRKNKWEIQLNKIINENNSGKLLCICSGLQSLGRLSEESKNINGLSLIDYDFYSLNKTFKSSSIINIGRKKIYELNEGIKLKDFEFIKVTEISDLLNPYFVHGYAARLNYDSMIKKNKYCYLSYALDDKKYLGAIISNNFCGTQFHPELSGRKWKEFMIRFFN